MGSHLGSYRTRALQVIAVGLGGVVRIGVLLVLTALGGLALTRYAPGFLTDEQQFDSRLSAETVAEMRASRDRPFWPLCLEFGRGLVSGDLGMSESFGYPVADLIRGRVQLTLASTGGGLVLAWAAALALTTAQMLAGKRWFDVAALASNQLLLVVPSGLLAFVAFLVGCPAGAAVGVIVFPQVYRQVWELAEHAWASPHVLAARARGSNRWRLLWSHVTPAIAKPLMALAGTSVALALGVSIPVEALSDFPGLGQLTWKAATGRDLPLLLPLVLVAAAVTLTANWFADLLVDRERGAAL